jgi:hypothetical protein
VADGVVACLTTAGRVVAAALVGAPVVALVDGALVDGAVLDGVGLVVVGGVVVMVQVRPGMVIVPSGGMQRLACERAPDAAKAAEPPRKSSPVEMSVMTAFRTRRIVSDVFAVHVVIPCRVMDDGWDRQQ